jgi:secreted trypsin-like serine protease
MGSNQKNSNFKLSLSILMLSIGMALSCGTPAIPPSFGARIINGEDARPNSWPWMVFLTVNSEFSCGGSILDKDTILTAAHCVDYVTAISSLRIGVGLHNRSSANINNLYSVSRIIIHPQYNNVTFKNDVAIIKLRNALTFSDRVSPVCLPPPNSHSSLYGKNVVATGWGRTQTGKEATLLQQAQLKVLLNETLFNFLIELFPFVPSEQYAVIEYIDGNDSDTNICSGDSGGPLVYFDGKKWTIFGVTSHAPEDQITGRCLTDFPSFFQSVPFYLDFINGYLNSTSISTPTWLYFLFDHLLSFIKKIFYD